MGKDSEIVDLETPKNFPNPSRTELRDLPNAHGYPTNIVFKSVILRRSRLHHPRGSAQLTGGIVLRLRRENPGGEFRKSYHGYPSGTAQLIHSPTAWVVEPMQVFIQYKV